MWSSSLIRLKTSFLYHVKSGPSTMALLLLLLLSSLSMVLLLSVFSMMMLSVSWMFSIILVLSSLLSLHSMIFSLLLVLFLSFVDFGEEATRGRRTAKVAMESLIFAAVVRGGNEFILK